MAAEAASITHVHVPRLMVVNRVLHPKIPRSPKSDPLNSPALILILSLVNCSLHVGPGGLCDVHARFATLGDLARVQSRSVTTRPHLNTGGEQLAKYPHFCKGALGVHYPAPLDALYIFAVSLFQVPERKVFRR
jgi:hypothetical protein